MAAELKYAVEKPRLVIGFLALFSFIAAAALRAAWRGTFHNLFQVLARLLDVGIGFAHPFGFLAGALRDADNSVYNWLGKLKDASGHAFITLCLWVAMQVTMLAVAIAALSYEVLRQAHIFGHRTSVTVVKKTVRVVTKPIARDAVKGRVAHDSRVPALEREIKTLRERIAAQDATIAKVQAITLPAPATLPQRRPLPAPVPIPVTRPTTVPKVSDVDNAVRGIRKQLGKLARYLTPAGIIGLVGAATFGGFHLGWLKCRGVNRVGRALCGMSGFIETLFSDAILAFAITDLCRWARLTETIAEEARPMLLGFVDVEQALIHCPAASYPRNFKLAPYSPTPVFDGIAV